ncbi:MAG: molybdenum metabolism regulator [Thiovulaceae bacterium]|nr:molybdenum metabolism regulator [Sulfurimonadaceae bacterium]
MLEFTLYRSVKERIRYYSFAIHPNLFGEFLLERRYGSLKNKRATGVLKTTHATLDDAKACTLRCSLEKQRRGYAQIQKHIAVFEDECAIE